MQQSPAVLDFADLPNEAIQALLDRHNLFLTPAQALSIQHDLLRRPPTLAECVLFSMKHTNFCSYKLAQAEVATSIMNPKDQMRAVTIATDKAGYRYQAMLLQRSFCFTAATPACKQVVNVIGDCVREISCIGAEVVAFALGYRFGSAVKQLGDSSTNYKVIASVADYGNRLGVPYLNGDIYWQKIASQNDHISMVGLGLVRADKMIHACVPHQAENHVIILVGKTDFTTDFLQSDVAEYDQSALREVFEKFRGKQPDAVLQRHLLKANDALFKLLSEHEMQDAVAFKSVGSRGMILTLLELVGSRGVGVEIDFEKISIESTELEACAILCSRLQEGAIWIVPAPIASIILQHYNNTYDLSQVSVGASAVVIGKIRSDHKCVVTYRGKHLIEVSVADLLSDTDGEARQEPQRSERAKFSTLPVAEPIDYEAVLLALLANENIVSRKLIHALHDKQVQGHTLIEAGSADATVLQPFHSSMYPSELHDVGIALSIYQSPGHSQIDAYWGAVNAVVASVRHVVAVGAMPAALTYDNCEEDNQNSESVHDLVHIHSAVSDVCKAINITCQTDAPFSFATTRARECVDRAVDRAIFSPIIGCLGVLPSVKQMITPDFKRIDTTIILVGARYDECGGSIYFQIQEQATLNVPMPDLTTFQQEISLVHAAIQRGTVLAVQTIARGGLAVALARMTFQQGLGVKIELPGDLPPSITLFSETGGFLLEVPNDKLPVLRALFADHHVELIRLGRTTLEQRFIVKDLIDIHIESLRRAWENDQRDQFLSK